MSKQSAGFTFVELVVVIVIIAIISIAVAPKLVNKSTFEAYGFADQVLATLRYAQKSAIAQHQPISVTLAADKLTLGGIQLPDRQSYDLNAPTGVTLSSTVSPIIFNALGQPSSGATITVSGVTTAITVEAETGYVH